MIYILSWFRKRRRKSLPRHHGELIFIHVANVRGAK